MKIGFTALAVVAVLGSAWFFSQETVTVYKSPSMQQPSANPMRGAPELVTSVETKDLDFSELDTPFSPDSIDTEIDGRLRTDEYGDLIIDTELKAFFDYFLSSVGIVTPQQAIRRIKLHIAHDLPEKAAQQAITTLTNYLAFKEASIDLMAQPIDTQRTERDERYRHEQLKYALTELKALRREYMGNTDATAFFLDEEAYGDYTIQTQSIALNEQLSEQEKQQQRQLAQSQLPEHMREHVVKQEEQAKRSQALNELLARSPSNAEFSDFVYKHYSAEEAARLVSHYQKEYQFRTTYERYREAISHLQTQGLSEKQIQQEKQNIAQQYFDGPDLSKAQAMDSGLAQSQ